MAIPVTTVGFPGTGFSSRLGNISKFGIEASPWYQRITLRIKISGERSKVISPTRTITETYDYDKSKTFNRAPLPYPIGLPEEDGLVDPPTLWGNSSAWQPEFLGFVSYSDRADNAFYMEMSGVRRPLGTGFYERPDPDRSLFVIPHPLVVSDGIVKIGEKNDNGDISDLNGFGLGLSRIWPTYSGDSIADVDDKIFQPNQLTFVGAEGQGGDANFPLPSDDAALRDLRGRLFTQTRAAPQGTYWDSSSVQTRINLTFS